MLQLYYLNIDFWQSQTQCLSILATINETRKNSNSSFWCTRWFYSCQHESLYLFERLPKSKDVVDHEKTPFYLCVLIWDAIVKSVVTTHKLALKSRCCLERLKTISQNKRRFIATGSFFIVFHSWIFVQTINTINAKSQSFIFCTCNVLIIR